MYRRRTELKAELAKRGLSLADVARKANNVSYAQLSSLVNGRASATLRTIRVFADVLAMPPAVLFPDEYDQLLERERAQSSQVEVEALEREQLAGADRT